SGFFFQAEDGIRDFHVTGVQTCALPISGRRGDLAAFLFRPSNCNDERITIGDGAVATIWRWCMDDETGGVFHSDHDDWDARYIQIGRAACREGQGGLRCEERRAWQRRPA